MRISDWSSDVCSSDLRTKDDISWSPLPLFHLNALAATVLASAMTFSRGVLYPRFSVSNFWPEIERSGATLANLLGSMLAFVADAPDNEAQKRCFGQLRAIREDGRAPV